MKFQLVKNPVITLLSHFTGRPPDDFRIVDDSGDEKKWVGPQVRVSKKPDVWKGFWLPTVTIVAWQNFDWGFQSPSEIEFDPEWLHYTDWNKKGLTFPICSALSPKSK